MNNTKVDWRTYAVHNDKEIKGFFGLDTEERKGYKFLSNFQLCQVALEFNGFLFDYVENAFMAAKSLDLDIQSKFVNMTPSEAKAFGHKIQLRTDWEEVKEDFMFIFNFQKYEKNLELRTKLLDTGDRYLEETNSWMDREWGVDYKTGEGNNKLGKILMRVRKLLRNK